MGLKLRSVNVNFWSDDYIQELNPNEKLMFLYLLTNPKTELCGIYEISIKTIIFETGLTEEEVNSAFEHFERDSKVIYYGKYIILPNYLKNQKLNPNMKINCLNAFNQLPESIKQKYNSISKSDIASVEENEGTGIFFTLKSGEEWELDNAFFGELKIVYGHNLMPEFERMEIWLKANERKRKTEKGMKRFINSWLSRNGQQQTSKGHKTITIDSIKKSSEKVAKRIIGTLQDE